MKEIILVSGCAGTGKTSYALNKLINPLIITKTRYQCNKFFKMGYSKVHTSAKMLKLRPKPFYVHFVNLKYKNSAFVKWVRTILPNFEHYYDKRKRLVFEKPPKVSYKNIQISSDLLLDDWGLLSSTDVQYWIQYFQEAVIKSERIIITFDPQQLNYGGLEFIQWIKETYSNIVEETVLTREYRFDNQEYTWHDFNKYENVPIISSAKQAPKNSIFISHSIKYLKKARTVGGWSNKKSINIDKVQGRDYDTIIVGLLGLAALYRNKIPGYKERIYTTITRGKNFIFYVPEGVSKSLIDAAIRDVINALSEINRPKYDNSILNSKTPKNNKSCMTSHFIYSLIRHRVANCNLDATYINRDNYEGNKYEYLGFRTHKFTNRLGRFWKYKPCTTALARLLNCFFVFSL